MKILRWGASNFLVFRFAGVNYRQQLDGAIDYDQIHNTEGIADLDIPLARLRCTGAKCTAKEVSALRHKLGELMWVGVSTDMRLSARIGLILSEVREECDMAVALEVHQMVQEVRSSNLVLRYQHFNYCPWQEICFVGFGDAALHNRRNGGSTGGMLTVACHKSVEKGELSPMSVITWRSWKLERKAVASNDGEVQAMWFTEDELFRLRLIWGELHATGLPRLCQEEKYAMPRKTQ